MFKINDENFILKIYEFCNVENIKNLKKMNKHNEKKNVYVYLLSLNSSFLKLGSFGKPLREVRPTLIRLKLSRLTNSSVNPTMQVLRQLSKFNSVIWTEKKIIQNRETIHFLQKKTTLKTSTIKKLMNYNFLHFFLDKHLNQKLLFLIFYHFPSSKNISKLKQFEFLQILY